MVRFLPSFGRSNDGYENKGAVPLETKDAATRRASAGRGYVYAGQPYTPPGSDIERLVKDGYEKVIWAFKAVDATAEKLSSWPIACMEGFEPSWKAVEDEDALGLLNQYSNEIERQAKAFRYRLYSQFMLSKKGVFVEAIPSRSGARVAALNLLPPAYTTCIPDPDTFIAGFRVEMPGDEKWARKDLPVYDPEKKSGVLWLRKPHPTDPYSSITPLEAAGISLDLDFYARLYNRNFLMNDGRAGQLVAVKGGLSPEDAQELKARFTPGMSGAGRTTVIEADSISVQDTAISPRDAQYAELRNITKQDILIAMGTPESLWNASGRTFDNADAEKENWLDVTVLPLGGSALAGLDPLTSGGWDDNRRFVHDVSGEPVLRRRIQKKIEEARKDHEGGRITVDEWREIAELKKIGRPGSRVIWLTGGKVAVGKEEDEKEAGELKPVGAPSTEPVPGSEPGLAGFDNELDMLGGGEPATGQAQGQLTALTAASADLGLEVKAFNPTQPRYPLTHPQGGQFMDAGDIARWLAGKPLKDGSPASSVTDPNPGSTASPARTQGGGGGAARFLSHPDIKVREAAYLVTFPQSYPYPRVLGAPAAIPHVGGAPKLTKLASLRKGDVVSYSGPAATGKGRGPWAVVSVKSRANNQREVDLVNGDGDVISVTAGAQQSMYSEARTPHPVKVAEAKRTLAAAARAGRPAAAPAAPAAAPAAPAAPVAAVSGKVGPFVSSDAPTGSVFTVTGTQAGMPLGSTIEFLPSGDVQFTNAGTGGSVQLAPGQALNLLTNQVAGAGFTRTKMGQSPLPASAPSPIAPAGHGPRTTPGVTVSLPKPGVYSSTSYNVDLEVRADGSVWVVAANLGHAAVPAGPGQINGFFQTGAFSPAAPTLARGTRGPFTAPHAVGTYQSAQGGHIVVTGAGQGMLYPASGGAPQGMTPGALDTMLAGQVGGSPYVYLGSQTNAPAGPGPAPGGTPQPVAAPAVVPAPATNVPQFNLPPAPPGTIIYAHPQGKHIYVHPSGFVEVWKPDGKRGTTSATAAKLSAGHGAWTRVNQPATGPIPGKAGTAAPAPVAAAPAVPPTPTPAPVRAPASNPAPAAAAPVTPTPVAAAAAPTPASSQVAAAVIAKGVPTVAVDAYWSRNTAGKGSGSNPAAHMLDRTGTAFYVKSQDAQHADNEVAAARLYAAAGVLVPEVSRARLAPGSFNGQTGTDGITSKIVASTPDLGTRMSRNASFRDAVLEDFAVHAWLGNWDAMENDNTQTDPSGKPITIDVGGSLMFRARGGPRKLDDTVTDLATMQKANNTAGRTFGKMRLDSTDAQFVAGVERIAAISPAQIVTLIDTSMPSVSARKRTDLATKLVKRRADLAQRAGVVLPENRTAPAPAAAAPAGTPLQVPAAAVAATPSPRPAAAAAPPAAAPAQANVPANVPANVQAALTLLNGTSPDSILTPPAGYAYPLVPGAPVATALPARKPIKVNSLRKGDVIQYSGGDHTVQSIDRASGDITAVSANGTTQVFRGTGHPTGSVVAVARTPHPQKVAAARVVTKHLAAGNPLTPTPSPQQAPNAFLTTPSHQSGPPAASAARAFGSAQSGGYLPVPGQTYANVNGGVIVVHSDGSGTYFPIGGAQINYSPAQLEASLTSGTTYVPVGPALRTTTYSIEIGRWSNPNGDVLDVFSDGTGALTLAGGTRVPLNEDGVEGLVNSNPVATLPVHRFGLAGQSPSNALRTMQSVPTPASPAPAAAPAAPSLVGSSVPSGGWGPAGQIVPGAVFINPGTGETLAIGPRGGGKLGVGSAARNMSAAAAQAKLNKARNPWRLQTAGPSALVATAPAAPAAAPAAPAVPAPAAAGPVFVPAVGQPATPFVARLQPGQLFVNSKTGNTMTIDSTGRGNLTLGAQARGGTAGVKTQAMTARTLQANGWTAQAGPDIDVPGPVHNAAVRKAARLSGLPAVGTPFVATAPTGAVYPSAAVGQTTPKPIAQVGRGETVVIGGESWIVTETPSVSGSGSDLWGYRPGIDDPNTLTRQRDDTWKQGARIPTVGIRVDVVTPAAAPATNVPTTAKARAYDASLGGAVATQGVGAQYGAGFTVSTQQVPADQLTAGDAILVNTREAEGLFVVTRVAADHKGRQAVYGYSGTEADLLGTPGVESKLFLTNPGSSMRTSRVLVDGAVAAAPVIPRPVAPSVPAEIERTDISDRSTQAKVMQILNAPPPALGRVKGATTLSGQDDLAAHLYDVRGYNAHPDVVSETELDDYIKGGEIELFRGMQNVSGTDVAEDYRSGRHYPGGLNGQQYGTGTYAAYGKHGNRDSLDFATSSTAYGGGSNGVVVRMSIKADARVIEYDALVKQFNADRSPQANALRSKFYGSRGANHYAILMGYDVVRKSKGYQTSHKSGASNNWDDGFVMILNRSAVRISEKNYNPSASAGRPGNAPPPLLISRARHTMRSLSARHENDVDYKVVPEP